MASLFGNNRPALSQREALNVRKANARANLLIVVVFTLVNILLGITSGTYFLFSAFVPFWMVSFGMALCGKYPPEYYENYDEIEFLPSSFFWVMATVAIVITALYFLCWLLSKKQFLGWTIAALTLFSLDTVLMILLGGLNLSMLLDVAFHTWVIVSISMGLHAHAALKKLPPEEDAEPSIILDGMVKETSPEGSPTQDENQSTEE